MFAQSKNAEHQVTGKFRADYRADNIPHFNRGLMPAVHNRAWEVFALCCGDTTGSTDYDVCSLVLSHFPVIMAAATSSLSALLKRTTIEDHEEVIKACNATLKQSKSNLEAQHAKVVALLKLDDRYDDALRVFEESGEKLKSAARFEYAYALYKSGDLDQALGLARQISDDRGARHLEAQAVCISRHFSHCTEANLAW